LNRSTPHFIPSANRFRRPQLASFIAIGIREALRKLFGQLRPRRSREPQCLFPQLVYR